MLSGRLLKGRDTDIPESRLLQNNAVPIGVVKERLATTDSGAAGARISSSLIGIAWYQNYPRFGMKDAKRVQPFGKVAPIGGVGVQRIYRVALSDSPKSMGDERRSMGDERRSLRCELDDSGQSKKETPDVRGSRARSLL